MASDYTTNYNLDKYVATDKPNLRDQYNSAMDKIDTQLKVSSDNAALAVQTANNAAAAVSGKASQSDLDALATIIPANDFSGSSTVKDALDSKAAISYVNSNIARVSGYGTNLTGKKVLCIGDSLTHHTPVAKWWPQYLSENTGCTTYNFAVGGTGFLTGNPTFIQQLQNAHASNSFNDNDITDIIICGGYNDYAQSESSVKSAVASCITYARATFVNATIHIGAMLHGTAPLDKAIGGATAAQYRSRLIAAMHEACMNGQCAWIDGCWYWCMGKTDYDFGDGIHTNPAGQNYIAGYMASHLNGGSTDRIECTKLVRASDAATWVSSLDGFATVTHGIVNISGNFNYNTSTVPDPNASTLCDLGVIFGSSHGNCGISVPNSLFGDVNNDRAWLSSPRVYTWMSGNSAKLSVQSIHNSNYGGQILFFNLSYPFGL